MTTRTITTLITTIVGLSCSTGYAAKVPDPGTTDHRVRQVDYNPQQVYRITGYYGYALTVLFERNETIEQVVLGDPDGWEHDVKGFVLSLKPKALEPDTSMVVLTNRREYVFDLRAKKPRRGANGGQAMDREQAFLVRFRYPELQAAREAASQAQLRAEREAKDFHNQRLEAERQLVAHMPIKPINRNYSFSGSRDLAPMEMWDDGQFTYLRFSAQQGIPGVYTVSSDGTEVIASKHFEQDVLVIQKISRKLVLRRGTLVACLWNEGPRLQTQQPRNGSSDPASARLNKQIPKPVILQPVKPIVPRKALETRYSPPPRQNTAPPVRHPQVSATPNDSLLKPAQPVEPRKRPAAQPKPLPKGTAARSASNSRIPSSRPAVVATPVRLPTAQPTQVTPTSVVPTQVVKPATFSTVE